MTTQQLPTERPAPLRYRVIGLLLLAATAALLVCAFVIGERPTDLASLQGRIASGDVTEVRLSEGLPGRRPGLDDGRDPLGGARHHPRHLGHPGLVRAGGAARRAPGLGPGWRMGPGRGRDDTDVVVGDVAAALTTGGRTVEVVGSTAPYGRGSFTTSAYGLDAPGWIVGAGLLVVCATLLLVGSREPWRATRWAWAWIILGTPIGVAAFVLLGGPMGSFRPRPGAYRLTGGWAFLLAGAISTVARSLPLV